MSSHRIRRPLLAPPSEKKQEQEQPQIAFSYFNAITRQTFLQSTMRLLGHNTQVHRLKERDVVLCYDRDQNEVFAICKLRNLDGGKVYRETHLCDQALYSGAYTKYSNYEIGVDTVEIQPTSLQAILQISGLPEDTRLLPKGHFTSFKRPRHLINQWHRIHRWIRYAITEAWLHH